MQPHTAYINIGTNKGDRLGFISEAVALIESALGVAACRAPIYQSPAWGYASARPYLNMGITISSTLAPIELLRTLRHIEHTISPTPHRDTNGAYIDRELDIDLICIDDIHIDTPELTLPHPRMHQRPFVLIPMACLLPTWQHPVTGLTPSQMLDECIANG
jgi:2-amino-4-hydroxy-6-hydroxymethyldihydropteridine diphosphokinase